MLKIEAVSRGFGERPVLQGVSFEVPEGALTGMIGPGGGGKSVLLKVIGGVYEPDKGTVEVGSAGEHSVSLMFQEGALFDSLSVYDNVAFPLVGGRVPSATLNAREREFVYDRVCKILSRVGLSKAAHKVPGQLSGGMRKRVSLARALVGSPRHVLLDDPTAGLDPVASSVIMDLIVELHREYRPTVLVVSQDLRRLLPVVGTIFALFDGSIAFQGSLDELRKTELPMVRQFVSCRFDLH